MKRRNALNFAESFGKSLFRDCMAEFKGNRDIAQISVQTENYAISITRNTNVKEVTHAIGFQADWDDFEEYEGDL